MLKKRRMSPENLGQPENPLILNANQVLDWVTDPQASNYSTARFIEKLKDLYHQGYLKQDEKGFLQSR